MFFGCRHLRYSWVYKSPLIADVEVVGFGTPSRRLLGLIVSEPTMIRSGRDIFHFFIKRTMNRHRTITCSLDVHTTSFYPFEWNAYLLDINNTMYKGKNVEKP